MQEQDKLQAKSLMEEPLEIQINDPLCADDVDLRKVDVHVDEARRKDSPRPVRSNLCLPRSPETMLSSSPSSTLEGSSDSVPAIRSASS